MPDRITINEDLGIIEVYSHGELTLDQVRNTISESIRISHEKNIYKVLVNTLDLVKIPGVVDVFKIFSELPQKLFIAHVMSIDQIKRDLLLFGENVALNRGKNVKFFDTIEEAVAWLKSL